MKQHTDQCIPSHFVFSFTFFIFKLVSFMSSQASTHNNQGIVQAIRHFNLVPRVLSYPSLRRENLGTRSSSLQKQKGNWDELTFTKTSGIVTRDTEKKTDVHFTNGIFKQKFIIFYFYMYTFSYYFKRDHFSWSLAVCKTYKMNK